MSDNPYVMYLIVRESLAMSPGKLGAQCGHAVQLVMDEYYMNQRGCSHGWAQILCQSMVEWRATDHMKIVLRANEKEWEKLQNSDAFVPLPLFIVTDRGYTEVPANTETVMALWPMRKNERPSILRRLRLL